MIPQTTDTECQEYLDNELLASVEKSPKQENECLELIVMINRIKEEADSMAKFYEDEDLICEICLKRLEIIIGTIRQCKNDENVPID